MVLAFSFLVVAVASILRLCWPNPSLPTSTAEPVPPRFQLSPDNFFVRLGVADGASQPEEPASFGSLRERVRAGDASALEEARTRYGLSMMRRILDASLETTVAPTRLFATAAYIAERPTLRTTPAFARAVIAAWQTTPTADTLGVVLRAAALADDLPTFTETVGIILRARDAGRLTGPSEGFLIALIENEASLTGSALLAGPDGFALRRHLSGIRRTLRADRRNP